MKGNIVTPILMVIRMKFIHTALVSSSIENATRFYEELLGLQLIKEFEIGKEFTKKIFSMDETFSIRLYDAGGAALEVFIGGEYSSIPSPNHVCLEVEDRETLKTRADEMGYRIVEIEREGTYDLLFIHDHDGNIFEIKKG